MSSFDAILDKLPSDSIKANIIYNLESLENEESKEEYKNKVISSYHNGFEDMAYLFFNELYKEEIDNIHLRISYTKHDRVIRRGIKCKFCKSTNTFSEDKQKGGGDEYIPSRVTCFDCQKEYLS